jgi:hypothetical protein
MKHVKHFILYAGLVILFGALIIYLLRAGKSLDIPLARISKTLPGDASGQGLVTNFF